MIIEPVKEHERQGLLNLAVSTGLFGPDDAEALLGGVLDSLAAGELPQGHAAVACRMAHDAPAIGWSYYAPDPYAEHVWNIWWIGVSPDHHGQGVGEAILSHVEQASIASGARVIVVETSDQAPLARARKFYLKLGYEERGRVPDFYAKGDSKVIYSRSIDGADRESGTSLNFQVTKTQHVLAVVDFEAAVAWFTEKLGFTEHNRVGGWSFLHLGDFWLMVGDCRGEVPARATGNHSWFAYVNCEGIDELYQQYRARQVPIKEPIADKPWGLREFLVETPEGHRIKFGQALR